MEQPIEEERRKQRVAIEEEVALKLVAHMRDEDQRQEKEKTWHIGKEIPIATIVVLVLQTAGVVWWAASTSAEVRFVKEAAIAGQSVQATIDRKQDDEVQRSEGRVISRLGELSQKLDRLIEQKNGAK